MSATPTEPDLNVIPIRRAGIHCHELDGEAVLYDPAHHAVHYLNATAYFIWQNCAGDATVQELLAFLRETIGTDGTPEDLDRVLVQAMNNLVENGLIDWRRAQAA